ncbi:acetyl-CoA C-acetyltransferase [Nonomuraea deserti]|uniref:Acetyl-CoA C-acetyltransferase n=1 Tax=Nonomuraea deserti TaxID=1848322 RepID=A0A4R4W5S3_9ACTN|nr:acetyl-CoA C-acetyltransferase [Nonomuraea deserti]TDD11373.1 acetyl-CoA C-acetyltransferase [Nonomuraea deserti]
MSEAYIVGAVRTPVGRRNGGLAGAHPADLGAHVLKELMRRAGADPSAVDDVIFGCVDTIGPQAGDVARTCWLAAGLPEEVPGVTIDRQCGSSQQALHFAAQAVLSGTNDLVVAGGVQNMSMVPISAAMLAGRPLGHETPFEGSKGWAERYGTQEVSQFAGAERIAARWEITREEMERYAYTSHRRALHAIEAGHFLREIVPYEGVAADEGPRADTSPEKMAGLKPLTEGGRITAALASQISDGAAALLVASPRGVREHGLTPRARVHHLSARGADPITMLSAPIPATARALRVTGMSIDDFAAIEVNEAFASVVLAWMKETGADPARVNPNGGAIALGHPLGATGAVLAVRLLHELERTGGTYGLQVMCEGGGQANVTVIERLVGMGAA